MTLLAVALCSLLFAAARGDTFSINNPDGLIVSIKDGNERVVYWSRDNFATVETLFATATVTVIAQHAGSNEIRFQKVFTTSKVATPVCNYALFLTDQDGDAHWLSSQSASACTVGKSSYMKGRAHACVTFDNASPHKVSCAFGNEGEDATPDPINDPLAPGTIRAYCDADTYIASRRVKMGDAKINVAVFDPFLQHNVVCGESVFASGTVSYVYQEHFQCTSAAGLTDTWDYDTRYYSGDRVVFNGEMWEAQSYVYHEEPSASGWFSNWRRVTPQANSIASVVASPKSATQGRPEAVVDVFAALGLLTVIYGSYHFYCQWRK